MVSSAAGSKKVALSWSHVCISVAGQGDSLRLSGQVNYKNTALFAKLLHLARSQLQPRAGEVSLNRLATHGIYTSWPVTQVIISHLEEVEDTKGNGGDNGYLYVTNLRVIWTSATQGRVNLSERAAKP